jgi:hypothetical protein
MLSLFILWNKRLNKIWILPQNISELYTWSGASVSPIQQFGFHIGIPDDS